MAISIRCKNCKADNNLDKTTCSSCGIKFGKKRKYRVVIRKKGRRVIRTVDNLALAREIEDTLKEKVVRGELGIQKALSGTMADVWDKYLPWAKENKSSWKDDERNYKNHIKPVFHDECIGNITQFDIEKWKLSIQKKKRPRGKDKESTPLAPATVLQQLQLLSRLFNLANQWGLYIGGNPCNRVQKPRLNNEITEFFTQDELARLHNTLDQWPDKMTVSIILFSMYTGIRRGEIFKLTWADIDMERNLFTLKDPKGVLDQILPMSSEALEVLKKTPKEYNTKWIFYGKNGQQRTDFKGPWARVKKAAKLPQNYRFHGLRHNFASYLASDGESIYMVQKLMCHKDVKTTMRYAHLTDQAKQDAATRSGTLLKPQKITKIINIREALNAK